MSRVVSRTCTVVPEPGDRRQERPCAEPRPLSCYRSKPAYVLLGDPGAGKTTAFEAECEDLGDRAVLVAARDFLALSPRDPSEWKGKTLFVDGLDEIRAGAPDARTPFDRLRERLDRLGRPPFRLSCRHADWLGDNDRAYLNRVCPNPGDEVVVLRLDPLSRDGIEALLRNRLGVNDAAKFIQTARERGVDGLLENPLSLDLLVRAVAGGTWPGSRQETFELACRELVAERNQEHRIGRTPLASGRLLKAAGRMCAVQLLAGASGFVAGRSRPLRSPGSADDRLALEQCCEESTDDLEAALRTGLFRAEPGSAYEFVAVHRQLAEFLGARYLAGLVDKGLPSSRAVALMTGFDGMVVTALRGLAAWLAVHCEPARAELIERDPVGVGLYGDLRGFSPGEKRALLESLQREAHRIESPSQTAALQFVPLATPDTEEALHSILTDADDSVAHQSLVEFVLEVLADAPTLPGLRETLLDIVRRRVRWPAARVGALRAFLRHSPDSEETTAQLKALLIKIQEGSVSDTENELRESLLARLYPHEVTPDQVWRFLTSPDRRRTRVLHPEFWNMELDRKSSECHRTALLDSLCAQLPRLQGALESNEIEHVPVRLLAGGIGALDPEADATRLYDWLGVLPEEATGYWSAPSIGLLDPDLAERLAESAGLVIADDDFRSPRSVLDDCKTVGAWLVDHPEAQKSVILEGLRRATASGNPKRARDEIGRRLALAIPPPDIGSWCLDEAIRVQESDPAVAGELFRAAVRLQSWIREGDAEAFRTRLRRHAAANGEFREILEQCRPASNVAPVPKRSVPVAPERRARRQDALLLEAVAEHEQALLDNRAPAGLLYRLAGICLGVFEAAPGESGAQAIRSSLGDRRELADAALQGLRGVPEREDLPEAGEILDLQRSDRMHYLGLPFLAALRDREIGGSSAGRGAADVCAWPDARIGVALACFFTSSVSRTDAEWYERLLDSKPVLVADVLRRFAASEFRSARTHIRMLPELSFDPAHAAVARHAVLPLLGAFPLRCRKSKLGSLRDLLQAALQHADLDQVAALIEKKASRKSIVRAQRILWLAAGLLVDPDRHRESLREEVKGRERRLRSLTDFLRPDSRSARTVVDERLVNVGEGILQYLILLIGSHVDPPRGTGSAGPVATRLKDALFVSELIRRLGASSRREAGDALDALLAEPDLFRWQGALLDARRRHRAIRRDADYRHPSSARIREVLRHGPSANAGDLAALLVDRLNEIGRHVRRGNSNDWRQYWNENEHGKPVGPKPENSCRDALLAALRRLLPDGVDAQPEGQYARGRRCDVRVAHRGIQVPIEIKKSSHGELWSGISDQVVARYASDPAADGHGIYLVFWHGPTGKYRDVTPPPSGATPGNAGELKLALESRLTNAERRKISVCVIDVSPPD